MAFAAGTRLGHYEIVGLLGAGGMGEVYRARDVRLSRPVALKVLSAELAAFPERLARFEREARAASALSHPAIVAIHDIGQAEGHWFIAMELVDGTNLRACLTDRPLAPRRLLDLAIPIAQGLAHAHRAGIVHRDLKPENVMVARDGVVKIVDFGIAKLLPGAEDADVPTVSVRHATARGVVVGTVSYMSPEQTAGRPVNVQTDQFSFGTMLREMATGRHPFLRETVPQTQAAIIEHEPPPARTENSQLPLPLSWVIDRCLAKDPAARYGSTDDLARDLVSLRDHLSDPGLTSGATTAAPKSRRARPIVVAAIAATIVGAAFTAGWFAARRTDGNTGAPPSWRQITFRQGRVSTARYAGDGQTVVYGGAWDGRPLEPYVTTVARPESRSLDLPSGNVVAVSATNELLVSLGCSWVPNTAVCRGTLARVPLLGGAPREVADRIDSADWSRDGRVALVRRTGEVEFPIGTVLSKTGTGHVRVAPNGRDVAWVDQSWSVVVKDDRGQRELTTGWFAISGLAWIPDGHAVLISGQHPQLTCDECVMRVGLDGTHRPILTGAGRLRILDVNAAGDLLVDESSERSSSTAVRTRDRITATRELNWFDGTYPEALSRDGRTLMFTERGKTAIGRGEVYPIFVRPTDGGPAKSIGVGYGVAFSPDGRWALTRTRAGLREVSKLILYALGTGEQKTLDDTGLQSRGNQSLASFAGPRTILSVGRASGQSETRTFAQDMDGGPPVMLSHEPGVLASPVAPDGNHFVSRRRNESRWLATITASESSPLPGTFSANEGIMEWTPDGRSVYVSTVNGDQLTVAIRDLATGREATVIELQPSVRQGFWGWAPPLVTPDGRTLVTRELRTISALYVVSGVR